MKSGMMKSAMVKSVIVTFDVSTLLDEGVLYKPQLNTCNNICSDLDGKYMRSQDAVFLDLYNLCALYTLTGELS